MALTPVQRQAALAQLAQLLRARGVDPAAASAVFNQEGASGGIGDSGHAFGPGQFNDAGGVWTGRYPGMTPEQKNAVAWSPAGLRELADRVARVAAGLHGGQAVRAIVSRFERPADVPGEISRALAGYGGGTGTHFGGAAYGRPVGSVAADRTAAPFLANLISSTNEALGLGTSPTLANLLNAAVDVPGAPTRPLPAPTGLWGEGKGKPAPPKPFAELLLEGTGGPTHSTGPHVHVASTNPQQLLHAITLAQQLGLHVGENPYVDTVDPVHAKNSYHYRTFPGLFNGRRLGEAIDVSGPGYQQFYKRLGGRA